MQKAAGSTTLNYSFWVEIHSNRVKVAIVLGHEKTIIAGM